MAEIGKNVKNIFISNKICKVNIKRAPSHIYLMIEIIEYINISSKISEISQMFCSDYRL